MAKREPRYVAVLDFVAKYQAACGYPPTQDEIAASLGVAHGSTARAHLIRGRDAGVFTLTERKARGVAVTNRGRRVLKAWRDSHMGVRE